MSFSAILVLYMTQKLRWNEDKATFHYHAFSMMVYFLCTFGAILSDVWLGKFKTILILSVVYAIGSVIVTLGAIPTIAFPADVSLYIGLLFIALGSGGIKPCVSAFGGDQFKMPEQTAQMATFFSLFYFSINSGSLISMFVTPIFRADVHCFGENDCYSLAFGVPAILMVTSICKNFNVKIQEKICIFKVFCFQWSFWRGKVCTQSNQHPMGIW